MVSDDEASNQIWLGHDGAVSGIRPGTICIECSTLTVNWVQELAAATAAAGGEFLDAPVTGSKTHAAAGELNFIVGGSSATLEKVRPVLAAMSKSIVLLGPLGSGAFFKLINNFICGVQVAALAEAVALIERGGLDRGRAVDLLKGGAAGSPLVQTVAARMTSSDYTPNFLLRLMTKDLRYVLHEGQKLSLDLMTATAALTDFQNSIAAQDGDKDIAAVVEQFRGRG
jgi:3-hydroxyisobutyrate dehydrogenase